LTEREAISEPLGPALPGEAPPPPYPLHPTRRPTDGERQLPPTPPACARRPHPNRSAQPLPASPRFLGARASRLLHSRATHHPRLFRCTQPGAPPAGERQLPPTPPACAVRPHPNRSAQPLPASPRFLGARASRLLHSQATHQPRLIRCTQPGAPPAGEPQLPPTPPACAMRPHPPPLAQPLPASPRFLGASLFAPSALSALSAVRPSAPVSSHRRERRTRPEISTRRAAQRSWRWSPPLPGSRTVAEKTRLLRNDGPPRAWDLVTAWTSPLPPAGRGERRFRRGRASSATSLRRAPAGPRAGSGSPRPGSVGRASGDRERGGRAIPVRDPGTRPARGAGPRR